MTPSHRLHVYGAACLLMTALAVLGLLAYATIDPHSAREHPSPEASKQRPHSSTPPLAAARVPRQESAETPLDRESVGPPRGQPRQAPPLAVVLPDDDPLLTLRRRDLLVPVEGIEVEELVPSFDQKRGDGLHEAIDLLADRGVPVLAVDNGRVAKLFTSERGGLTVYQFDPDEQFAYYYAHLDRYEAGLQEGDTVLRGDVIGYVGTTGNAPDDTPHLHFAIFVLGPERQWWKGVPVDPYLVWTPGRS